MKIILIMKAKKLIIKKKKKKVKQNKKKFKKILKMNLWMISQFQIQNLNFYLKNIQMMIFYYARNVYNLINYHKMGLQTLY